jgi:hypothetical protein
MNEEHINKAEDIISRRVGNDVVVIKDDGQSVYILNKTAAFIWDTCDGISGVNEIVTKLCEHFEVTPEEAREDVKKIIKILTKLGIITYNKELSRR